MKKIRIAFLAFTVFLISLLSVNAACTMEENSRLSTLGINVSTDYEVIQKAVENPDPNFNPPDGLTEEEYNSYIYNKQYFRIHVTNITEDLYITVQKNQDKEKKTYSFSDAVNGVIDIDEPVTAVINNYTITIYSSNKTNCPDTKLATRYVATPRFNDLSNNALCEGIEEFYLCHKYLPVSTSFDNYEELMNKYRQGKINAKGEEIKNEEEEKGKFSKFVKEHRGLVAISVVGVIAIGGLVTVIIVKKQRSRVI